MTAIKKIVKYSILLGVIAISLNLLLGMNETTGVIPFITRTNIGGINGYKFNFFNYFKNLETALTSVPRIIVDLPTRQWHDITASITEQAFWEDLVNNLAYMLDIIIAVANIFLFPIRLAAYVMQIVLSIIGIPMANYTGNPLEWLIEFINNLATLQIPYV